MRKIRLFVFVALIVSFVLVVPVHVMATVDLQDTTAIVKSKSSEHVSFRVKNNWPAAKDVYFQFANNAIGLPTAKTSIGSLPAGGYASFGMPVNAPIGDTTYTVGIEFLDENDVSIGSGVVSVYATEADGVAKVPAERKPSLDLVSPSTFVSIKPGMKTDLGVTIKNNSDYSANKIKIELPVNPKFVVKRTDSTKDFSLSANQSKAMSFEVAPYSELKSGEFSYTIKYKLKNDKEEDYSGEFVVYFVVEESSKVKPLVVISDFEVGNKNLQAGDNFTLTAKVKNSSAQDAENVMITLENLKTDEITTVNSADTIALGAINNRTPKNIAFNLNVSKKLKNGSYPLTFAVKYKANEQSYEEKFTYYLAVNDEGKTEETRAILEITEIDAPQGTLAPNEQGIVNLTVKNTGKSEAKNIIVSSMTEDGVVPKSANRIVIPTLGIGETKKLSFSFAPTAQSKTQSYTVGFEVDYETGEKGRDDVKAKDRFTQYSALNVSNPLADKEAEVLNKSVPKIIIDKYEISPELVMAGTEFDLDMVFKNTHNAKSIHNIKVNLSVYVKESSEDTSQGSVFTPVDSSNTFYIDNIPPLGKINESLRMSVVRDAAPKNYIIKVTFEYEDEIGNSIVATEDVGVHVKQVSKLEIGEMYVSPNYSVGDQIYLGFTVHNTGRTKLYNLKAKMEGVGLDTSNAEQIFGNMDSGKHDNYDGQAYVTSTDATEVSVVITYDDESGEKHEIRESFPISVFEREEMSDNHGGGIGFVDEMPPAESIFKTIWFWAVVASVVVVIIGVVTFVVIKKRRRKQEESDWDE